MRSENLRTSPSSNTGDRVKMRPFNAYVGGAGAREPHGAGLLGATHRDRRHEPTDASVSCPSLGSPQRRCRRQGGGRPRAQWPALTALSRSKEYLFLGSRIPPDEAVEFGGANRVLAPEQLMPIALALAHRLAQVSPAALAPRRTRKNG
jgi:hypothetical protein